MCGLSLEGKDAIAFLETLVVGDVAGIPVGSGSLSVFTNEKGGIIDDTVVTRSGENSIYLVVNAGCREKDLKHLNERLAEFAKRGGDVKMTVHDDRSLLALQGPKAAEVLAPFVPSVDLSKMYFSNFARVDVNGSPCFVTRTGYTGEVRLDRERMPTILDDFERALARARACEAKARDRKSITAVMLFPLGCLFRPSRCF